MVEVSGGAQDKNAVSRSSKWLEQLALSRRYLRFSFGIQQMIGI
jgi:hypothetical protein